MQRFKLAAQAQRFLAVHGLVGNLFRLGRHLLRAAHHRFFRERAFQLWNAVTARYGSRFRAVASLLLLLVRPAGFGSGRAIGRAPSAVT